MNEVFLYRLFASVDQFRGLSTSHTFKVTCDQDVVLVKENALSQVDWWETWDNAHTITHHK